MNEQEMRLEAMNYAIQMSKQFSPSTGEYIAYTQFTIITNNIYQFLKDGNKLEGFPETTK